jgi:hypothetical protein
MTHDYKRNGTTTLFAALKQKVSSLRPPDIFWRRTDSALKIRHFTLRKSSSFNHRQDPANS